MTYRYIGLALITCFSLYSSIRINPLYHGTGALTDSKLIRVIGANVKQTPLSAWIVSNKLPFESLPVSAGAKSYSGVYPYPQTALWAKYFPGDAPIYNRFAHVEFNVNDAAQKRSMQLVQGDTFSIQVGSCDSMLRDLHIDYILTTDILPNGYSCFHQQSVTYAGQSGIFIYRRNK